MGQSFALENRRLDLADLLVEEDADVLLPIEDFLPRLARARRAQRIGFARPAERRLRFLVRLEQRFVGPLGRECRPLVDLVQVVEDHPRAIGGDRQALLDVLNRLVHALNNRAQTFYPDYIFSERAISAANGPQGTWTVT
jgi:hypothetical protein